jgi:hypothetical protein
MSNGAEIVADGLMDALLLGEDFNIPVVDLDDPAFNFPTNIGDPLYNQVAKLTNEDLTSRTVNGAGTFDAIMASQAAHLQAEFVAGRIVGGEYTKAYSALAQAAASQAIQYLLGKDQAYWAAVVAQGQALTARVQLEIAKAQLASALIEANNQRATFALNKIRLANEDAQYGILKYTLDTKLPAEVVVITEQGEAQRAQTLDTRSDALPVAGSVKSQKDLYAQQVISYQRSSEVNGAKVWIDAWTADSALQDSPILPTAFTAANISSVLTAIKTNNVL